MPVPKVVSAPNESLYFDAFLFQGAMLVKPSRGSSLFPYGFDPMNPYLIRIHGVHRNFHVQPCAYKTCWGYCDKVPTTA